MKDKKPKLIFVIGVFLAIPSLLYSIHDPVGTFGFFAGIFIMILYIFLNIEKQSKSIVFGLFILFMVIRLVPAIRLEFAIGDSQRHVYAAEYIIESGHVPDYYPVWQQQPYMYWPGSHLILVILNILMKINTDLIHKIICPFIGALTVIFFYLFVKEITQNEKLAVISSLIIGVFRLKIFLDAHDLPEIFSILMMFVVFYSLGKAVHKNIRLSRQFFVISLLAFFVLNISHHEATYMFLISIFSIWVLYKKLIEKNSMKNYMHYFLLCTAITVAWWMYIATGFLEDITTHAFREFYNLLKLGIELPWCTLAVSEGELIFLNGYFRLLGSFSSTLLYGLGLFSMLYILSKKQLFHKFGSIVVWAIVISSSFIISGFTQLGNVIDASRQISFYLPYSFSIMIAIIIEFMNKKTTIRLLHKKFIYILLAFIVFAQCITAFPLYFYDVGPIKDELGPFTYTANDKYTGLWVNKFTNNNSLFLADTRTSCMILFWGCRQGTWAGDFVKSIFESDKATSQIMIRDPFPLYNIAQRRIKEIFLDYLVVDNYNTKYKFYQTWGMLYTIPENSLILQLDSQSNLNRIYDNGKDEIFGLSS